MLFCENETVFAYQLRSLLLNAWGCCWELSSLRGGDEVERQVWQLNWGAELKGGAAERGESGKVLRISNAGGLCN